MLDKLRAFVQFVQFVHGNGQSDEGVVQDDQGGIGHLDKEPAICPKFEKYGLDIWTNGLDSLSICPIGSEVHYNGLLTQVRFNGPG